MKTIVAQATATGQAGIGIVRISGDKVKNIAQKVLGFMPKPRYAHFRDFLDESGVLIDQGIAIFYPKPHSFTGEDVLELQAHSGSAIIQTLLETSLALGCVLAEAGEFSQRAFLNGKMDLLQAEAVADLIQASSRQSAQSALRSLRGEFSHKINTLTDEMIALRVLVEATIDFSDEDIDTSEIQMMKNTLAKLRQKLTQILDNATQGKLLREGIYVVIAGKPNAGKSSLLNALTKEDSAIVTPIAGTTRDVLTQSIHINGVLVHIVDTAGLHQSTDLIEQEGIKRAYQVMEQADCVLLVFDANQTMDLSILPLKAQNKPLLLVRNKIDLTQQNAGVSKVDGYTEVSISAKQLLGLNTLKTELLALTGLKNLGEHTILARNRHTQALKEADEYLQSATEQIQTNQRDMLAEDLRLASYALGKITGHISSDDLLGEIFNNFCVGK